MTQSIKYQQMTTNHNKQMTTLSPKYINDQLKLTKWNQHGKIRRKGIGAVAQSEVLDAAVVVAAYSAVLNMTGVGTHHH